MLCRITINADDFGHSAPRSKAIAECFANGLINRTTLMVNMPDCESAVELSKVNGFSDRVGLHLNFTEGFPLTTGIRRFRRFCNPDGSFVLRHPFVGFPYIGEERAAVKKEILAQVRKYKSFDLPLMHCDGHHHIQSRWPIAEVLFPILKAEGFRSFRNCYPFPRYDTNNKLFRFSRYTIGLELLRLLKGRGLSYADVFMDWNICSKWIKVLPKGLAIEVMVHPKYDNSGVLYDNNHRMSELLKLLNDP